MSRDRQGVFVSLALPQSIVTLNEPVFADFVVENALDERVRFDLGHNRKSNLDFNITGPQGLTSSGLRLSEEGLGRIGRMSVEPNEAYRQRLELNEWYHFAEPGKYQIAARLSSPLKTESGKVVEPTQPEPLLLEIGERDPERLRQVAETLMSNALESSDVQDSTENALALSHIIDPIAVAYLGKVLNQRSSSWPYVMAGLARIANQEAIDLLTAVLQSQNREAAALAEYFLKQIKREIAAPDQEGGLKMPSFPGRR